MNWNKVVTIGVVGGVVLWLYDFVMHGFIMRSAYVGNEVFAQEGSNPLWFLLIEVCIGVAAALLFVKTRSVWGEGAKGGLVFGFFLGLLGFFPGFFNPLIIADFPYYLAWCWGGITLIGGLAFGVVAGLMYKQAPPAV